MKRILWAALAVLLLVSCGSPVTAAPEKPLELSVDNLKGKWVLEGDSSVWYDFKVDGEFSCTDASNSSCTNFEIIDNKVKPYKLKSSKKYYGNELTIVVYKNKIILNSKQYIRQ